VEEAQFNGGSSNGSNRSQVPKSTVLSVEQEAVIIAFRKHTLLPLDDCLYALQATIPQLTRPSLHRCLERHGISRLPEVEADKPRKKKFDIYPIGFFHMDRRDLLQPLRLAGDLSIAPSGTTPARTVELLSRQHHLCLLTGGVFFLFPREARHYMGKANATSYPVLETDIGCNSSGAGGFGQTFEKKAVFCGPVP
jgi:hypothetical protein